MEKLLELKNIYLRAALLGVPKKQVDRDLQSLIEFTGVRRFYQYARSDLFYGYAFTPRFCGIYNDISRKYY